MEENAKPNREYINERDAQSQEVSVVSRAGKKGKGQLPRAPNPGHLWKAGNTLSHVHRVLPVLPRGDCTLEGEAVQWDGQ